VSAGKHSSETVSARAVGSAGSSIGRYEVLEALGSGSTGVLYRAHDHQLGRQVSLEVLHATSADPALQAEARERLLREAQALARLSHPNVAAAYDVGMHDGALFIAMEFVEGVSLRDWLAQPRRQAEVVRVLVAAGRGLVAAHQSHVLHGGFDPANVMISSDGRVRVVDLGLSREATPPAVDSNAPSDEQFRFAVTAFIALTGQKPYPDGVEPTDSPLLKSARTAWPRSVPRALRHILDRGLSPRPEHRYPSLAAMVGALERFASPGRERSKGWAVVAAFAASAALPGATPKHAASTVLCKVHEAALTGVWDSTQRARVEQAFRATGSTHAGETFALVTQRLEAFQSEWVAMRRDSCEATLVRGEQPERVMVLRATCLDRALEGAKAFVGALGEVDDAAMNRVAEASPASLKECADAAVLLGSSDQLPADPSQRAVIAEVEVGLGVNRALLAAGSRAEAVDQAQRILELAREANHLPALAKAAAQQGKATLSTASTREQRAAGEAMLNESMRVAAKVGDAQLMAETASYLFYNIAYAQTRVQEGKAMLPVVEAVVRQAGNPPLPFIELSIGKSTLLERDGDMAGAAAVLSDVIRLAEENVGNEFRRFANLASSELGFIYSSVGRHADAEALAQRAVDGTRRWLGAHHPRMINMLANLANLHAKAGHRDLALETLVELEALAATMPPQEPRLKFLPLTKSRVWRNTGDCARAIPLQRQTLVTFTEADGPDHPLTTTVMFELGKCLTATDQIPEAISFLERVLANNRRRQDGNTPEAAFALAKALWQVPAQRRRARSLAEEARSLLPANDPTGEAREAERWLAAHPL
jgi:tetratricopeptide (TPR) repeat protein